MRLSIVTIMCLLIEGFSFAQRDNPVHWTYSAKKIDDKTFELHFIAAIDKDWHIYAQVQPDGAISQPTKIEFTPSPLLIFKGKVKEIGAIIKQKVKILDLEQNTYEKQVDFVQTIVLKAKAKTSVTGSIPYQACTEERCLQPTAVPFSLPLE